MWRADRCTGFTLLEVLVALAVAAVALSAAMKLVGVYVGDSAEIRERLYAHWAAGNVLVVGQLQQPWPKVGMDKGKTGLVDRDWHWRRIVTDTPYGAIRKVEVQVYGDAGDEDYITRFVGYVGENVRW